METLKYLEYCTHLAFLTIYQGRGRDFKSSYKCVRQTFGSELLCRHRLSLSKQPASPSVSPSCGNLLLLYKERRGQRGGPGEVCATDSGAGQVNEPYCLPLQISVRQQLLAFCLLLALRTHTLHTFMG